MMAYQETIEAIKPEFEKIANFFSKELAKIRTGQASPSLVEDVAVEVFNQKMPLKQLASISCPEQRQILISPWDRSYLEPIEKALLQNPLGVSPIIDKDSLRITLPQLTEELRRNLSKLISQKAEEAKEGLRRWRDEAWSLIQEHARQGSIREDDKYKAKNELQKTVDEYTERIEQMRNRKEKEIAM